MGSINESPVTAAQSAINNGNRQRKESVMLDENKDFEKETSNEEENDKDSNDEENKDEGQKKNKPRQRRQKIFGVIIDGEDSEIQTFKDKTELNNFIADECKPQNGAEMSQGRFRLKEGGTFTPIIGRTVQQKKIYQ